MTGVLTGVGRASPDVNFVAVDNVTAIVVFATGMTGDDSVLMDVLLFGSVLEVTLHVTTVRRSLLIFACVSMTLVVAAMATDTVDTVDTAGVIFSVSEVVVVVGMTGMVGVLEVDDLSS